MNFLFKIKQQLLVTIFIFLTLILSFFLYFQFNIKKPIETIDYKAEADIVNPRFIKEKSKDNSLEVIAKKASFLSKDKMFLEGNVKYSSEKFILESDMVNFNKMSFNASSNEKTLFKSEKVFIAAEGFEVKDKGNIISFIGKSHIEIQ